jgi:lipopolysaccharide O-acetyltransferase
VTIGDDVWIGDSVAILPGVTIGRGSVIGALSVVNKSIPEYCIAAGNPARVLKMFNFATGEWDRV